MVDLAEQLVGEEEGRDPCVYPDTSPAKLMTIAIGCVVDPRVKGAGLCDAAISAQFQHDSAIARATAGTWPNFTIASAIRQAVLISMAYQLGDKPYNWPNFRAALAAKDYTAAAAAGRDSDWWRFETPKRAERAMKMLETDTWVPHT